MKNTIVKGLLFGAVVLGGIVATNTTANADEVGTWHARTVEQIESDVAKTNGKEYTIVTGDTLSGIAQATNQTVYSLANRNSIANVDLIYAGNKLLFDGNVVTVQNSQGETIDQTVIQDSEKIDPSKPVGQPVVSQGSTTTDSTNAINNPSNSDTTVASSEDNSGSSQDVTASVNTSSSQSTTSSETTTTNSNSVNNTTPSDQNNVGSTTKSSENNAASNNSSVTTPSDNTKDSETTTPGDSTGTSTSETGKGETQEKWSVWYTGDTDHSKDIVLGSKVYATRNEARDSIEQYADDLLKQGITSANYGTQSWE